MGRTSPRPPCPTGLKSENQKGETYNDGCSRKLVENYISSERYSGIEWRIAQREVSVGRTRWICEFRTEITIPEDAVYRIYSMTKPIISVLALMLIERGVCIFMIPCWPMTHAFVL